MLVMTGEGEPRGLRLRWSSMQALHYRVRMCALPRSTPVLHLLKGTNANLAIARKHGVWGAKQNRFKRWHIGDRVAVIAGKSIATTATVAGTSQHSETALWSDALYPWRIALDFDAPIPEDRRPDPYSGDLNRLLREDASARWGFFLLTVGQPVGFTAANAIEEAVSTALTAPAAPARREPDPDEMRYIRVSIDRPHIVAQRMAAVIASRLGLRYHVATNDRKEFSADQAFRPTGWTDELALGGVSATDLKRIGLIDLIWFAEGNQAWAFEFEYSTDVAGGMDRIADYQAAVPAHRVTPVIVSPDAKQVRAVVRRASRRGDDLIRRGIYLPSSALEEMVPIAERLGDALTPRAVSRLGVPLVSA